jgi:hypothetical protein
MLRQLSPAEDMSWHTPWAATHFRNATMGAACHIDGELELAFANAALLQIRGRKIDV